MNNLNLVVDTQYYATFLNNYMGYNLEATGSGPIPLPQGLDTFRFQIMQHEAVMYVKDITEVYVNTYMQGPYVSYDYEEALKPFQDAVCYYIHYLHKMDGTNLRSENANANIHKKMCYAYLHQRGYVLS